MKKVLVLFIMFVLLIPNSVFALDESAFTQDGVINIEDEQLQTGNDQNRINIVYSQATEAEGVENPGNEEEENNNPPQDENLDEGGNNELLPAQIKNVTVVAKGVGNCRVEWEFVDCDKVHIKYMYGEVTKEANTTSTGYSISGIPFGETVTIELSTDEQHEVINVICNPSEEKTPTKVDGPDYKIYNNSSDDLSKYWYYYSVYAKDGNKISSYNYTMSSSKEFKGPGIYEIKVTFKGDYSNYKPLKFNLKIVPTTPRISYFNDFQKLDQLSFYVYGTNTKFDKVIVETSLNKDYSNPIKTTITRPAKEDDVQVVLKNLKRNTRYYTRVRTVKADGDKNVYSEYTEAVMHTIKPAPSYSYTQANVKEIISLMKKNKSFNYTFNGYYSYQDLVSFVENIRDDFPQYAGNYSRSASFGEGKLTFEYQVNKSRISKNEKLAKKINSIAKKAKKKKGVRAKVKYINKQMCKCCRYDYDTYKGNKKASDEAYSAYGCLVRGKAVCSGYAKAFHAICVQCNIQDQYAHGKNHIWNKVKVGKKWLHVDVTWNDCTHSTKWLLKSKHKG